MIFRMITPRPVIVENRYRFLFGFIWSISGWFLHLSVTHVDQSLKDSLRITGWSNFRSRKVFERVHHQPIHFWSRVTSRVTSNLDQKCTFEQFENGPKLQVGEIHDLEPISSFGPLSNRTNLQFWSKFVVKLWTKRIQLFS